MASPKISRSMKFIRMFKSVCMFIQINIEENRLWTFSNDCGKD